MARDQTFRNRRRNIGFQFYNPGRRRSDPPIANDGVTLLSLLFLGLLAVSVPIACDIASHREAIMEFRCVPGWRTFLALFGF